MKTYLEFVESIQAGMQSARNIPLPSAAPLPAQAPEKPTILLFSPHPDDECITGVLPLRLMRETACQILNIPVTYGSLKERQAARAKELDAACGLLGWGVHHRPDGYAPLTCDQVVQILECVQPKAIVMPHAADWNPRHIWTHDLVVEALTHMDHAFRCAVIETEFWGAMDDPNLMVEADAQTVADLVAATALHAGEVSRNPYHLLLPAWMQDNVRRGGELVGGAGAAPPPFAFATLYRLRNWSDGAFRPAIEKGTFVPCDEGKLEEMFTWK